MKRAIRGKILISIVQLGTIDYATGLKLQQQLVALRKEEKIGDALLLLEHKPVITLGRNAKAANVVASPEFLSQRGVELFACDRGGDVTFHGPGQIVGYPIFDLRCFASPDGKRKTLGVIEFVRRLEQVLMRSCADFGVATKRVAGLTGVWTDPSVLSSRAAENDSKNRSLELRDLEFGRDRHAWEGHDFSGAVNDPDPETTAASAPELPPREAKLAAIGVHVSRFVTSHGFALNVNTDLSYFTLIIPCGITGKPVTSMQEELGRELNLNAVAESISRNFCTVFQAQILRVDTLEAIFSGDAAIPGPSPLPRDTINQSALRAALHGE